MIAHNNPLNIRYAKRNQWKGQTGSQKGFCTFETLELGYRAALVLARNHVWKGNSTLAKLISVWAPESENNTGRYISFVAKSTGLLTTATIDSIDTLCYIVSAMAIIETASTPTKGYLRELCYRYNINL